MKIDAVKIVSTKIEIEVDDRIYKEDTAVWQIANMLLDGALDRIIGHDLYSEEYDRVSYAAERINAAFKKADDCIRVIKEGNFEV